MLALLATSALASGLSAFNSGVAAHNRRDDELAFEQLTLALNSPDLPPALRPVALFDRAESYFARAEFQNAVSDCDAALAARPDMFDALLLRAVAEAELDEYKKALADADAAVAARPELPIGLTTRAYIRLRQGDVNAAIADDTSAIALDPKSPGPLVARAFAYGFMQHNDAVVNDLEAASELAPDRHAYDINVGEAQWALERNADALSTFEAAATHDPTSRYPLLWKVIVQSASSDALADLKRNVASFDLQQWPGPIVSYYLGVGSEEMVRVSIANAPPSKVRSEKCEANFYVAEFKLLHRDSGRVSEMLTAAVNGCPFGNVEMTAAHHELARLGSGHANP
jgi:lipoprotein NlpI